MYLAELHRAVENQRLCSQNQKVVKRQKLYDQCQYFWSVNFHHQHSQNETKQTCFFTIYTEKTLIIVTKIP